MLGKSVVAGVVSGTVRIKRRNGKFRRLRDDESIPVGQHRRRDQGPRAHHLGGRRRARPSRRLLPGRLRHHPDPRRQADHAAGAVRQAQLRRRRSRRRTSAKKKKVRRLWGDGKGRFRTKGRHGAATVKGTKWLTEDRCGRTKVTRQARHGRRPRLRQAQEQGRQEGPLLRGPRIGSRDAPDRRHRPRRAPRPARARVPGLGRDDHERDRDAGRQPAGRPQRRRRAGAHSASTYNATGNDGTFPGCPCEGWGAGADGPTALPGHAPIEDAGNDGYRAGHVHVHRLEAPSRSSTSSRGDTPALRLTQDFHPSPTTPNLYEITTTLENITGGPLSGVRYERVMDWDVEPTPTDEFVTINRGPTPPADLIYSDDNGFARQPPVHQRPSGETDNGRSPTTVNANYVDNGPADHGARFTFGFGDLAAGESKQFFLYYGAAGNEADANAAVSAAALEVFSYGQPNTDRAAPTPRHAEHVHLGLPRRRRQRRHPAHALADARVRLERRRRLALAHRDADRQRRRSGPGRADRLRASPAPTRPARAGTTDGNGQAGFGYTGSNAGDDTITACLDADNSGGCDAGEVTDTATKHWDARPSPWTDRRPPPRAREERRRRAWCPARSGSRARTASSARSGRRVDPARQHGRRDEGQGPADVGGRPGGDARAAVFYQGAFVITQTRGRQADHAAGAGRQAELRQAKRQKAASTSARKKKVRRLWGDGKGRFRTKGRHGAATVAGTKWLTEDRCNGTLVRVKRGVVAVRDFASEEDRAGQEGPSPTSPARRASASGLTARRRAYARRPARYTTVSSAHSSAAAPAVADLGAQQLVVDERADHQGHERGGGGRASSRGGRAGAVAGERGLVERARGEVRAHAERDDREAPAAVGEGVVEEQVHHPRADQQRGRARPRPRSRRSPGP